MERTKEILEKIGIEPERLDMFFLSGAMGATFANVAIEMTERIRDLGPNPLKTDQHKKTELEPTQMNID